MRAKLLPLLLLAPLLVACEQVGELLELPNPQKDAMRVEAEGKAIGGACRQTGRSLEDCYVLNPGALKAAVFAGWREMNDYMLQNNMQVVPSQLPLPAHALAQPSVEPPAAEKAGAARPARRPRATPST
jgi:hypothetical protein